MDSIQPEASPSTPPRLTRLLTIILLVLALACQLPRLSKPLLSNFALLPVATVGQSKLWNVLTAGFIDSRLPSAVINLTIFFIMGRWIESAWRPRPLLAYLVLVNSLAGILTYIVMFAAYVATRHAPYFFTPIATSAGLASAVLVAIKQLIPDHEVGFAPVVVRATHLPLLHLTLTIVLVLSGLLPVGILPFTAAALHVAWLYLRYLRPSTTIGTTPGDTSETFAYHTLYPSALHGPIRTMASLLHAVCIRPLLRNVDITPTDEILPNGKHMPMQPAPKASAMDTERRRQRALKVLDERLNAVAAEKKPDEGKTIDGVTVGGDNDSAV